MSFIATWAVSKFGAIGGKLVELIIALLLLLALVGGPYYLGWSHRGDADDAKQAQAVAVQAQQTTHAVVTEYKHRDEVASAASSSDAKAEGKAQARTQVLHQEVIRYVTANPTSACQLDADGLRIWLAANAGDPPGADAPSPVDPGLPGPAAAGGAAPGGAAGQPRDGGGAVLPVPGQAPGA